MIAARSALVVLLGGGASALAAQSLPATHVMGQFTVAGVRADPTPFGGPLSEIRVVSPVLSVTHSMVGGHLHGTGTLNLERFTIPDGLLTPGAWGESFVDRRHPHTTVHELLLSGTDLLGTHDGGGSLGLTFGKGFAPFGTDDPMSRPFLAFPVNHHLAQILERAIGMAQYRHRGVTLEAAVFNGDEPEHPTQWPLLRHPDGRWRFGDSRSGRVTIAPFAGLELQGSLARVFSPEHRPGGGGYARKSSLSTRWEDHPAWGRRYLMAEWARTSELDGTFIFHSVLIEGELRHQRIGIAYRFESTERPEEERIDGRFRTRRPHIENSILGISRWALHTIRLDVDSPLPLARTRLQPFVEMTTGRVRQVTGALSQIDFIYDGGQINQVSVGVTMDLGMRDHRMGRYGVLQPLGMTGMHHHPE